MIFSFHVFIAVNHGELFHHKITEGHEQVSGCPKLSVSLLKWFSVWIMSEMVKYNFFSSASEWNFYFVFQLHVKDVFNTSLMNDTHFIEMTFTMFDRYCFEYFIWQDEFRWKNVIFDRFDDICFDILSAQNERSFLGKFQLKNCSNFH